MPFNFNFYNTNTNLADKRTGDTAQNVNVVDVICEGPVYGLVDGSAGVYLNDVAAEYAEFRQFIPTQNVDSGTITFSGTNDLTGSVDSNTTIPDDLENVPENPRALILSNYYEAEVSVTIAANTAFGNIYVLDAVTGTPFTADWKSALQTTAILYKGDQIVKGSVISFTSTSRLGFQQSNTSNTDIDTGDNYTLRISKNFPITDIDSTNGEVTVSLVPRAGTFNFGIGRLPTIADAGQAYQATQRRANVNKIKNLVVETRKGLKDQKPLSPVAGVGGSVAIPGDIRKINLRQLKIISASVANTTGLTRFDPNGMPTNAGDDVNEDVTLLPASSFGLDSNAKIAEVDEISWSIAYNAFQTISLKGGDKSTAYALYAMQIRVERDGVFQEYVNAFPSYGEYIKHQGNSNAASQFDHVLSLEQYRPFDNFEVRIARLSRHIGLPVESDGGNGGETNKDDWQLSAQASITRTSAVIKDLFSYPYSALASVSFSSKQFTSVPRRSYLMKGLLVKVPTNYTPREYSSDGSAVYDGFWGGEFKTGYYTDNPAWVFYDILTNNRYGAGKWIDEFEIDKYTLYRVARYCDELVPSGEKDELNNDILEPRFRANIFLAKATDVYKVLKDMATVFLGIIYWQDGKLVAVQDTPQDPVYTFSKSNVIGGQFSYETTGSRTRINQVIVTWNDPTINFEPAPLLVEDRESIVKTGKIVSQSAVAFGATSEGQALRYGKWKLWTAQNQTEIASFKTSLAAQFIKPGDVINIQDSDRYGVQLSGRLSSSTSNTVTLDRTIDWGSATFPIGTDDEYELSVLITKPAAFWTGVSNLQITGGDTYAPSARVDQAWVEIGGTATLVDIDTEELASSAFKESAMTTPLSLMWREYSYVQTSSITKPSSPTDVLTLSSGSFDVAPAASTVWAVRASKGGATILGSPKMYKVLGISQDTANEFSITAVEFYNEKFLAVEQGYEKGTLPDSIYPDIEPTSIPAPSNIRILLDTDSANDGEELFVVWDEPTDASNIAGYEVTHNVQGVASPLVVSDTKIYFASIPNGTLEVDIRAVSIKNNYSRYAGITYKVDDPFSSNVDRVQEGIPKGIISTSTLLTTSSSSLAFEKVPNIAVSMGDSLNNSRELNALDSIDISGLDVGTEYFVLLEDSTIELVHYDTASLPGSPYWRVIPDGQNKSFSQSANWTNIGGSITLPSGSNTVSGSGSSWTSTLALRDLVIFGNATDFSSYDITGVTLVAGSAVEISFTAPSGGLFSNGDRISLKETGTGGLNGFYYIDNVSSSLSGSEYNYTLDLYLEPDLLASSIFDPDTNDDNSVDITYTTGGTIQNSPLSARVISVVSDEEIIIDRTFEEEIVSGTTISRRAYRPNFSSDSIFAKVTYEDPGYSIFKYITLEKDLSTGKFVQVDTNVPILQYEAASPNSSVNHPADISFSATAVGFVDPLFKLSNLSAELDQATVDTAFQEPDSEGGFVYSKVVDTNGVGYTSGTSETITVEVVERTNTTDAIEGVAQILKTTAGADGATGRTAFLQSDDYSIIYNEAGTSPVYNDSDSGNDIDLTATAANFDDPRYKFTLIGTLNTPGDFTLSSNFGSFDSDNEASIAIPNNFTSWNGTSKKTVAFQVKVEIAESTDTATILAFDIITIQGIHALKGGYWVSLSNDSHTVPTSAAGVPVGTPVSSNVTGVNSGTTIEVGKGSEILERVTSSPGIGEFTVSASDVSGNGEVVPSSPTGATTLTTYGDHAFSTVNWTDDSAGIDYSINLEGEETIVRRQTFSKSKKGFGGITITNSNPVQALPSDKSGKVLAYTGSDVAINVLLSGESLPWYPNLSTASTAGADTFWFISGIDDDNITKGSPTNPSNGGLGAVEYGTASSFLTAESNATIVYNISVYIGGELETLSTSQFFLKNTNSSAVFVTATATHINYDGGASPTNPSPGSYSVNWSSIVPSQISAPAYKVTENSGTATEYDSATSLSVTSPTYASLPITYTVDLYEDDTYSNLLATDKVTVNKSKDGEDGQDSTVPGSSGAAVNLAFIRKSTTPTVGTGVGVLPNGESNGWTDAPPTGTNTLWATKGNRAQGATNWAWQQTPYRVDGTSAAEIYFYSNATTGAAPTFTAPTYNFTSNTPNSTPTNWNLSPPNLTAPNQKVYVVVVLYAGTPGNTTAAAQTTSSAVIYAQRIDGGSVNIVFVRVPSGITPTATTNGTTDFPSNFSTYSWSDSPPTGGNILWAVKGVENSTTNVWAWGTPYQLDGTLAVELYVYQKKTGGAASTNNPPADKTYNFTNGAWSAPTGWQKGVPTITADDNIIYQSYAVGTGGPTTTNAALDWSSAVVYARRVDGVDGQDSTVPGPDGADGAQVNVNVSTPNMVYFYDGATWDPASTSATVTVTVNGLTSVTYSGTNSSTSNVKTVSFSSNVAEGSITAQGASGNISVSGNKSDGSSYSSGNIPWSIPAVKAARGATGDDGGPGFFKIVRTTPSTAAPTTGEIADPTTNSAAIVENSSGTQVAYIYNGSAWVANELISTGVISANAITANLIDAGAVTTNKLFAGAVSTAKLDTDAVTAEKIDANAVTAEQLQISNSGGSGTAGINMNYNGGSPKIEISDGTNIRVVLGYLS